MPDIPEALKALVAKQRQMEEEMEALADFLNQPGMPGLTGKLVDEEGFPRADIDLYAVRGARHRLHVLKTDYMEVRDQIEKELHALHAQGRVPVPRTSPAARATTSAGTADESDALEASPYVPFARVDELHEKSPAASAGIRLGDLVLRVGSLFISKRSGASSPLEKPEERTSDSAAKPARDAVVSTSLSVGEVFEKLPGEVRKNVEKEVDVAVFRNSTVLGLKLVPRPWEGMGLLGCRLTPLKHGVSV